MVSLKTFYVHGGDVRFGKSSMSCTGSGVFQGSTTKGQSGVWWENTRRSPLVTKLKKGCYTIKTERSSNCFNLVCYIHEKIHSEESESHYKDST